MGKPPSPLHLRPGMVAMLRKLKLHGDPLHGEDRKVLKTRARKNLEALLARRLVRKATTSPETYAITDRAEELIRLWDLGMKAKEERQRRAAYGR